MPSLSPVSEWPSFKGMPVTSYERQDGMRYAAVSDQPNNRLATALGTRIVYRVCGDEALLLGLMVQGTCRGHRLGTQLAAYFIETVGRVEAHFGGTGIIRKPVVALSLARVGLQPNSCEFMAEILPRAQQDTTEVPKIHILENGLLADEVIDRSPSGRFYDVVSPEEVLRTYPLNGPDKIVALHTRYQ